MTRCAAELLLVAARVHFPTFGERPERQKKPKVIVKELGRVGVFETTIANLQDADTALLAKIRVLEVKLRVLGDTGPHLVKMPTAQRVFEYRHGFACVLDLPRNRREPISTWCLRPRFSKGCSNPRKVTVEVADPSS